MIRTTLCGYREWRSDFYDRSFKNSKDQVIGLLHWYEMIGAHTERLRSPSFPPMSALPWGHPIEGKHNFLTKIEMNYQYF